IAARLHPADILRLSRVDKRTRRWLMSKQSRAIWVEALQEVHGLPACPPYMSEPRYVALLFGDACMVSQ
ncbi:hypothetical protein OH77DRAFT_1414854, partial [Trametes cingulata]